MVQNQTDNADDGRRGRRRRRTSRSPTRTGQPVKVPANDRVEVRFPVKTDAGHRAPTGSVATHGPDSDAAETRLPVYTPVTTEAFATYGTIDNGAIAQPVKTPTGVVPHSAGSRSTRRPPRLQALTDAVVYLVDYPYESADVYVSRIIAAHVVARRVRRVRRARRAEHDASGRAHQRRHQGVDRVQNNDGGFSTWTQGGDPQPYISVEAADAVVLARLAGYSVPDSARSRALSYIHDIESKFPTYWDTPERHAVSAYALYVRNEAGDRDAAKADALYRSDPVFRSTRWRGSGRSSTTWPSPAPSVKRSRTVPRHAGRRGHVHHRLQRRREPHPGSDRRTDGIVLDAPISMQPDSDLIPRSSPA